MAPKAKVWNSELVEALFSKASESQAQLSDAWYAWQKAAQAVQAVQKDIKITKTGAVQNLPRQGANFGKRARDFCEGIMRGTVIAPAQQEPVPALAAPGGHPYLNKMEHRGGGYAILRALWDAEKSSGYEGFLTVDQICRRAQPYCKEQMGSGFWGGRDRGHGWDSNRCLLNYGLIQKDSQRSWNNGYKGPKDRIRLTEEGRAFVPKMLEKFGDADDCIPLSLTPSQPTQLSQLSQLSDVPSPASQGEPLTPRTPRMLGIPGTPRTPPPKRRSFLSSQDLLTPTPKKRPRKQRMSLSQSSLEDALQKGSQQPATSFSQKSLEDVLPKSSHQRPVGLATGQTTPSLRQRSLEDVLAKSSQKHLAEDAKEPAPPFSQRSVDDMLMQSSQEPAAENKATDDPLRVVSLDSSDEEGDKEDLPGDSLITEDLTLTVDLRERCSDRSPRDIYEAAQAKLRGLASVRFAALALGDYMWQRRATPVGILIERKTIQDLVARSAQGDHLRQLRRLRFTSLPSALLLEGDPHSASRAIPYGAAAFAGGRVDPTIRDPLDVLCLLARVVLRSGQSDDGHRCFPLLTRSPTDTITWLYAFTLVIRGSHWVSVANQALNGTALRCDHARDDLLSVAKRVGCDEEEAAILSDRFHSLAELREAYRGCSPESRALLLAPLFHAGEGEAESRLAAERSGQLFRAVGETARKEPVEATMTPPSKLSLRATHRLAGEISSDPRSKDVPVQVVRASARSGVEYLRVELVGTAPFQALRSAPFHVHIFSGKCLLEFMERGLSAHPGDVAKAGEKTAQALVEDCCTEETLPLARQLFLFEGLQTAVRAVSRKGQSDALFSVAKIAELLVPATTAVLALKHGLCSMPMLTRGKVKSFLCAFFKEFSEKELLTNRE